MIAIRLRFLAIALARVVSRLFSAITAGSSHFIVPLSVAVAGMWLVKHVISGRPEHFVDWVLTVALYLLLVYVTVGFVRWVQRARRLTTFDEFVDQTGEELAHFAKTLSVRVPIEFNRLDRLNRPVQETEVTSARVRDESYHSLRVSVKADTVSTFLQSAVTAESTVGIGFLKLPLQAMSRFAGRFVQGPRITGTVVRSGDDLLVLAQMVGADRTESWQVRVKADADAPATPSDDVARELASRIFTTLGRSGRSTWRATAAFCDAMDQYRRYTMATSRERRTLYLMRAERKFLDTLAEDDSYDLAYFNLGIVYMKLGRFDAAQQALLRAIASDPSDAAPYEALARIRYFELDRPRPAIELAARVISCTCDTAEKARAYDLKGLAERSLDQLDAATASRRKAVALAWKALIAAELRSRRAMGERVNEFERELLSTCCRNLAVAYAYDADRRRLASAGSGSWLRRRYELWQSDRSFRRAELLLEKAVLLTHAQADLHFQLGKIYLAWGRVRSACRALEQASRADPANPELAAHLAAARARAWRAKPSDELRELVVDACQQALETPSSVLNLTNYGRPILQEVATAYETIEEHGRAERVLTMPEVLTEIEACAGDHDALVLLADRFETEGRDWSRGRVLYRLGLLAFEDDSRLVEARDYFEESMRALKVRHPGEIRSLGLKALLAGVHRRQELYEQALAEANSAVDLDPFTSYERNVLGDIHADQGEHAKSRDAYEAALLLSPDDPDIHWSAGLACWNLATEFRGKARSANLCDAAEHFEQALDLYHKPESRLKTHYWLGRLRAELGDYEAAIPHFRYAMSFEPAETLARFHLADSHLEVESYDEAVAGFRRLVTTNGSSAANGGQEVGAELGDSSSIAALIGWSYRGLAVAFLNRDVYLDAALGYVTRAQELARLAKPDERTQLVAACASCKGQLLLKLGSTDRAIRALEHAAWLLSDDETHLNLALAYERQLHEAGTATERWQTLRRAWAHTRLARRGADESSNRVPQQLSSLERRLEAWTPGVVRRPGSRSPDAESDVSEHAVKRPWHCAELERVDE